ncbi:hypothetical protein E2P81_ATG05200 [Venturia nashicola]|uniref:WW domain-containing protein n=1 Tax=Venturia nashicola TaxID=86259 RepID=A0A4Z1NWM2_9PEZI|nr:hypothetical protein E6O75_ATG05327 [Venturia nashicola]TLD32224.1 hypothetical protein E2P81_ATG05200 [Venturia nashicola]
MATPLPDGWTEHKAPTGNLQASGSKELSLTDPGHTYYYNKETKQSTYTRPQPQLSPPIAPAAPIPSYGAGQFAGGFSNHQFQNQNGSPGGYGNFPQQHSAPFQPQNNFNSHPRGSYGGRGRGGNNNFQDRRKPDNDRPKHKYRIPGCEPWVLVKTKMGRRFVHNIETKESLWKFPENVMKGVVEFDRREREKQEQRDRVEPSDIDEGPEVVAESGDIGAAARPAIIPVQTQEAAEDSSEYEEVTDSEGEGEGGASKRQRTEESGQDGPVDFNEDDIAYQLASMGQDYGLDPGEYGLEQEEEYEEGAEGIPLTIEDSKALFRELLDDYGINPYNPWTKIIEDGAIIEDDRYLALPNMRSRQSCFDEWARERIQYLKEQRAKIAKSDPRIPYLAFLSEHASTKLYWPEFKRKYRKESELKDMKLPDKEKEKLYREHVKRLLLPVETLKKDLSALLKSIPLVSLNRSTSLDALPGPLLTDLKYISLPPKTRDPMISAFISSLPSPPSEGLTAEEEEAEQARKRDRVRREQALEERERRVRDEKRRQGKDLAFGRERLKEQEKELERAGRVNNDGLKKQLAGGDEGVMDVQD